MYHEPPAKGQGSGKQASKGAADDVVTHTSTDSSCASGMCVELWGSASCRARVQGPGEQLGAAALSA